MAKGTLRRKLVIVGDGACGKTCLLMVFAKKTFPEVYIPTVFENHVAQVQLNNMCVNLSLWDTAGQEDYDRLRPLSYPESDVVLIAFAIDAPDSLDNVLDKWIGEVLQHCKNIPILLVALKKDLREDENTLQDLRNSNQVPVSYEQGLACAEKIGAKYAECSAKLNQGVDELFELAAKMSLVSSKKNKCSLL